MATDTTSLGIMVDATQLKTAIGMLEDMVKSSEKAATGVSNLEKNMTQSVAAGTAMEKMISGIADKAVQLVVHFLEMGVHLSKFQDLAEETGADPAGLAALEVSAQVAGVSVESIALAMNRLSKSLSKVDDESKGAGKALASIGINIEDFKALDPAQQYRAVAVALDGFADGAGKVAVAQELFGRGGARQLRAMKELTSSTEEHIIVTNEMIKVADDYDDANKRNAARLEEITAAASTGAIPALSVLRDTTRQAVQQLLGMKDGADALGANQTVQEWAGTAITVIGFLADKAERLFKVLEIGGNLIAGIAASGAAVASGNFKEAGTILSDMQGTINDIMARKTYGEKLAENWQKKIDEQKKLADEVAVKKPELANTLGVKPEKEKKPKVEKDALEDVMKSLAKKTELEKEEAEAGHKLTEIEKLRVTVIDQLVNSNKRYSETQWQGVYAAINQFEATRKLNEEREKQKKAQEEWDKSVRASLEAEDKKLDQYKEQADKAEEEFLAIGKTAKELDILASARLRDAAAALRQKAAMTGEYSPELGPALKKIEEQAKALERTAGTKDKSREKREEVKAQEDWTKSLLDSVDAERKRTPQYEEQARRAEEEYENLGKTRRELELLSISKLRDEAATKRQAAVMESEFNPEAAEYVKWLERQAKELDRAADAKDRTGSKKKAQEEDPRFGAQGAVDEYLEGVRNSAEGTKRLVGGAMRDLEDNMLTTLKGGEGAWRQMIDTFISEALRLTIIKPLMASLFGGPGGDGGFGGIMSLFGGFGGGTTGGGTTGGGTTGGAGGLGDAVAAVFSGGGFAAGGDPPVGKASMVGEKGPELFVPKSAGTIIPNNKLGGGGSTFAPVTNISIDSRSDSAQIEKTIRQANEQNNRQLMEHLKAQGVM